MKQNSLLTGASFVLLCCFIRKGGRYSKISHREPLRRREEAKDNQTRSPLGLKSNAAPRLFSLTVFYRGFSNSLIIHAALIQPEHLILVRWMGLETQ